MALSAKQGAFAMNTSTGNQSVTGVGFQPKVVLFFSTGDTADATDTANGSLYVGAAVSSSSRFANGNFGNKTSGLTPPNARYKANFNDRCMCVFADVVVDVIEFVSMDSDGFTVNITTSSATARVISYLAIGGADLTNVAIKQITAPASTGNQATTGVGFRPDAALFFSTTSDVVNSVEGTGVTGLGSATFGAADGTNQNVNAFTSIGADSSRAQAVDKVVTSPIADGSGVYMRASLSSFDSDGFTLNWDTVLGDTRYVFVVCLKGGRYHAGAVDLATSTGNQAITGVGFTPVALLARHYNATSASGRIVAGIGECGFGGATGSSARGQAWTCSYASNTQRNYSLASVLRQYTPGTPTALVIADFVSFDSDGFTINQTTADGSAREILHFTMGSNATTASLFRVATLSGLQAGGPFFVNPLG
jgi:hypothetical protein